MRIISEGDPVLSQTCSSSVSVAVHTWPLQLLADITGGRQDYTEYGAVRQEEDHRRLWDVVKDTQKV